MPRTAGPTAKRLKLKDISTSDCESETSRKSRKSRGKLTRNNANIGNLTIEEANRIAEKITGYHCIDLRLPNREEADAAGSMRWVSTFDKEDVVIQRKLCMICMKNPMDAFLKPHVREIHSEASSEVAEIMKRMSDVRYTRFCNNGYITSQLIHEKFPTIPHVPLVNFLTSCGFVHLRKCRKPKKDVNFGNIYEEPDIRGVPKQIASKIVSEFKESSLIFHDELSFSADLVTSSRMLDLSTQTTVCCHICDKTSSTKNFARHVKLHQKFWDSENKGCSLEDLTEVLMRITEARIALYYSAQPIRHSELMELCGSDGDVCQLLVGFLLDAGFVIDSGLSEKVLTGKGLTKTICFGRDDEAIPCLLEEGSKANIQDADNDEAEMPELIVENEPIIDEFSSSDHSNTSYSMPSTRSRSNSLTSGASSTSSASSSRSRITVRTCSNPSDQLFPYCVLNGITEHIKVEHALFKLLEAMTDDSNCALNQPQFTFLLGYTSYCLVVANGSKQNVVSRLTMKDYRNAKLDEASGLHYFSFSTKSTCKQKDSIEFLCADEKIWRAMEIFEAARERRAQEAEWSHMDEPTAPFFCSYVSPTAIVKDTNYPMSQFLRMCGIEWPCRSSAICSAAWSLVPRDREKSSHHQYSITYFKILREKERSQVQLIDDGGRLSSHPTYKKITSVAVSRVNNRCQISPHEKVRKKQKRYISPERRGLPNRPRGGDHKSEEFLRRTGRYVPRKPSSQNGTLDEGMEQNSLSAAVDCDSTTPHDLFYDERFNEEPSGWIPSNEYHRPEEVLLNTTQYKIEVEGDRVLTCL